MLTSEVDVWGVYVLCISAQPSSAECIFLPSPMFVAEETMYKIHVMPRLFPNTPAELEQMHIF